MPDNYQYSFKIGEKRVFAAKIRLADGTLLQPNTTTWSFAAPRSYVFDKVDDSNQVSVSPNPIAKNGETERLLCECTFADVNNPTQTTWNAQMDLTVIVAPAPAPPPTAPVGITISEVVQS